MLKTIFKYKTDTQSHVHKIFLKRKTIKVATTTYIYIFFVEVILVSDCFKITRKQVM